MFVKSFLGCSLFVRGFTDAFCRLLFAHLKLALQVQCVYYSNTSIPVKRLVILIVALAQLSTEMSAATS